MFTYTDKQGKLIEVTQPESGVVTIYCREVEVATRYSREFDGSLDKMKEWAQRYIATKLDPILSREDFYQVSFSIRYGMLPEHRYATKEI